MLLNSMKGFIWTLNEAFSNLIIFDSCSSLTRAPASKKGEKAGLRSLPVRRALFTPSPAPVEVDHSSWQLPLKWNFAAVDREAFFLGQTGRVREKYLRFSPTRSRKYEGEGHPIIAGISVGALGLLFGPPASHDRRERISLLHTSVEAGP